MKILLVNKYFNMHGGSETYFFGLADLLRQAGHEVIFFAMQDEKNLPCEQSAYFVSNVEFNGKLTAAQKLKAAFRMVYSFEAKKKISALIEKEKVDGEEFKNIMQSTGDDKGEATEAAPETADAEKDSI